MDVMELKKIFAIIPAELYEDLKRQNLFNNDFDNFVSRAIRHELERMTS